LGKRLYVGSGLVADGETPLFQSLSLIGEMTQRLSEALLIAYVDRIKTVEGYDEGVFIKCS